MSKISPYRAAVLRAKTASLARPMPPTRNPDGSIIPRDKTGGAAARQAATAAAAMTPALPASQED
ncbi:MAG: hypothetical protein R3E75_08190 [Steroidobacteraceae bacterium]|nr:hypothetical protein [Nevskiaceae bacterium]MCP5472287.1 hypothetical protein [Nevskiaceae bacterium]